MSISTAPASAPASANGQKPATARERFNRPPRIMRALPRDEVAIPVPPDPPSQGVGMPAIGVVLPIATALLYLVISLARGGGSGGLWLSLPTMGVAMISAGVGIFTFRRQRRLQRAAAAAYAQRCDEVYDGIERHLEDLERRQRAVREGNDPDPAQLLDIAGIGPDGRPRPPRLRLWERRPADGDFAAVRLGLADQPTSLELKPAAYNPFHPIPAARRAYELAERFAAVRDMPLTVPLAAGGALGLAGPRPQSLAAARAMLLQLAVHHAPAELRIAACWPQAASAEWAWLRWLPHTRSLDGDDSRRLLALYDGSEAHLRQLLDSLHRTLQERAAGQPRQPQIVLLLDAYHEHGKAIGMLTQLMRLGAANGLSVIYLVDERGQVPGPCAGYLDLGAEPLLAHGGPAGGYIRLTPDGLDAATCERVARRLAAIARGDEEAGRDLPSDVRLLPLLGVADPQAYAPAQGWADLPAAAWHPVPIGVGHGGAPLLIDLNEGAHGVHGMIAGTTGSGKSELLLSLLLALAVRHGPDRLSLLLIDFKGGATFAELAGLPHTVGVVTDLEGYMAERALIAINSELDRRKHRLAQAGAKNIHDYRSPRRGLERQHGPIPNLLIAIDEFDEMAHDYPQFAAELVRVAKQGRSLGVHLLLVTQQPSTVKEGVANNMTYRIALRLVATEDSRVMTGLPDAAYLTTETPGRGYFRVGKSVQPFQSARVTAAARVAGRPGPPVEVDVTGRRIVPAGGRADAASGESELALAARLMAAAMPAGYAASTYPIWAPPLGELSLGELLPSTDSPPAIARLDMPDQAAQRPLEVLTGGASGHLLIMGAAGAGKTSLLRTLILAQARAQRPDALWMYVIDPGGSGCGLAAEATAGAARPPRLPHIADAIAATQATRVERLLSELQAQVERRRRLLQAHACDSLLQYQARHAADSRLPTPPPAILLVIDQIGELAAAAPQAIEALKPLLRDARACGISVAVSGSSYRDVAAIQSAFELRLCLRVNDPADSEALIGKGFAARLRPDQPGRGFLRTGERPVELQVALPSLRAGDPAASDPAGELAAAVAQIAARHAGVRAGLPQPLRELPARVGVAELERQAGAGAGAWSLPVALDDLTLQPLCLELDGATPHLLVAGGPRSGKTSLLRGVLSGLAQRHGPDALQLCLVDYRRRELGGLAGLPQARGLATDEGELRALVEELAKELEGRRKSGAAGPRLILAISDWELLLGQENMQLDRLAPYVFQGRDLGFHLLATSADFAGATMSKLFKAARQERSAALLGEPVEGSPAASNLGLKLPRGAAGLSYPPGRGFLMLSGKIGLGQCGAEA